MVSLALRLAAGWYWQSRLPGKFGFGDSESYWVLAQAVAEGRPYQYSPTRQVYRARLPFGLGPALSSLIGGTFGLLRSGFGCGLGTLGVGGVGWIAWELFGRCAGLVAAGLAAIEPGSIAAAALVLSEALFVPLMIAQIGLWIVAWKAESGQRAVFLAFAAGLAAGAASLTRPSWLLFTPLAVAAGLAFFQPRRCHLGIGITMLAGLVVAMMPWWIRNARVTGHFVPTTVQVGASLYDGWNPQATGASDMSFVDRFAAEDRSRGEEGADQAAIECRLDRRIRQEAVDWALDHPGRVLELAAIKLTRMWNLWPNEAGLVSWPIRLAVLVTFLPIMALCFWRAAKTIRGGWLYVLCWLPAMYFSLLHMVFVSSIRYRQPPMMLWIAVAGGVAVGWRKKELGVRS